MNVDARELGWGQRGSEGRGESGRLPASPAPRILRDALGRNRSVVGWSMERTLTRSSELYLAGTRIESTRHTEELRLAATLYVRNGDRMGSASLELAPGEVADAEARVEESVELARAAAFEPYQLPGPAPLPEVATIDSEIVDHPDGMLDALRGRLIDAVDQEERTRLASAEFFLFHDEVLLENSEGLTADRSGTRATCEIVLLSTGEGNREAEGWRLTRRRRGEDLEIEHRVSRLSEETRDATRAEPTPTWEGPVLLGAEHVRNFFDPLIVQASAESAYDGTSHRKPGAPYLEGEVRGDRLSVATDATLPYGTQSASCDDDGVPARRVLLIDDGIFQRRWGTQRYASYLGTDPTGSFSNLVVEPGNTSDADLGAGPDLLEVRRFSWLNPRQTGDLSSEIRFGYLRRGGRRIPIRGGLLTGDVFAALADCRLARETAFAGNAQVPVRIRFNRLRTVGV